MLFRLLPLIALMSVGACSDTTSAPTEVTAPDRPVEPRTPVNPEAEISPAAEEPATSDEKTSEYWGVAPGEPLPITWQDLLPEGAIETYFEQQDQFYAELENKMNSGAKRLSDIEPGLGIEEGSELDVMPQFGTFETVDDLAGQLVRIPGYVVPFNFASDDQYTEFLFVPYMGACLHTPPPPPNQVIYVRAARDTKITDIWIPYWLEGDIQIERNMNDLGNAAYTLDLVSLEPYPVPG